MNVSVDKYDRITVILLRCIGISGLLAIPAVFMPFSWMNAGHQLVGLGEIPDDPIVSYLARSLSAFYAIIGSILLFISFDLARYRPLVKMFAVVAITFGIALLIVDLWSGMPLAWLMIEGPLTVLMGATLFWLQSCHAGTEVPDEP